MRKDILSGLVVEGMYLRRRKPKPISRGLKIAIAVLMIWVFLSEWGVPLDLFWIGMIPVCSMLGFEYWRWRHDK